MGIAIIGTGAIAQVHAEALISAGVPISAVSGVDQLQVNEFAERFKVESRYENSEELLASEQVTSAIIATPSQFHSQLTIAALERNKPVLCEVPLSLDFNSFEEVNRAAEGSRAFAAVAQTLRYSEPHLRLKEILSEISLKSLNVLIRNLMFRQENIGWTGVRRTWTDSVLWHHGSHALDLAAWLLDSDVIETEVRIGPPWTNNQVMEVSGFLRSSAGHTATVILSYHSRIPYNDLVAITDTDTFEISKGILFRNEKAILSPAEGSDAFLDAVLRQDLAFLKAVKSGDLSDVVRVQQLEQLHGWLAQSK